MNIFLVLFFVLCTAFFVAAEYAIIRSRMSLIGQLAAEGNKKAEAVKQIVSRLDEYLSACQLGNTLTNLALGWLGESTVERLLSPAFDWIGLPASVETIVSFLIAFLIITFLEVVVGELVPKIVAIQKAEPLALLLAPPLMLFFKATYPFSWLLNRSARLITGLFGIRNIADQENNRTEAELRLILSEGYRSGIINPSEFRYVTNIFELDEQVAKGIMVPRMDMEVIDAGETVGEVVERTLHEPFDYYPVVEDEDKDRIVGVIDYKELLAGHIREPDNAASRLAGTFKRPIMSVIDTVSVQELMLLMQQNESYMAVLIDEFGGTSGIVTIRDIIARIVGERRHRKDEEGVPMVEQLAEGHYSLSAKLLIDDVNRLLKTGIEDEGVYTLGGWVLSEKHVVKPNDRIVAAPYEFIVTEMDDNQIKRLEALKQ